MPPGTPDDRKPGGTEFEKLTLNLSRKPHAPELIAQGNPVDNNALTRLEAILATLPGGLDSV